MGTSFLTRRRILLYYTTSGTADTPNRYTNLLARKYHEMVKGCAKFTFVLLDQVNLVHEVCSLFFRLWVVPAALACMDVPGVMWLGV